MIFKSVEFGVLSKEYYICSIDRTNIEKSWEITKKQQ